ncbi:hypothetical protein SAMN02745181_0169 [Rubritalea squalenifaciens DSM 18772]|uniref:Thioredoxin family protein n=1 Tax=Rubritalea squalenifaciens DSM 18772 TaxID=1123071 RepID=A0A1M6BBI2_9BACT|nr:hypothetical protein SAMN02745181_0169 [Rubritalea squalenifaciens DSM 18772]
MKAMCVLMSLCMAMTTLAGFKIPSGVYEHTEMKEAIAEAKEEKLPLVFIYTDKGTT